MLDWFTDRHHHNRQPVIHPTKGKPMRIMLDCAELPATIPPCDVLAGYITSPSDAHDWSAEDWSRAKAHAGYILPIHVAANGGDAIAGAAAGHQSVNDVRGLSLVEGSAVCIDVEHANAAHAVESGYAAAWCGVVGAAGFTPLVYGSATDQKLLAPLGHLWLAKWGHADTLITGSVATQFDGGPGKAFDQSVVADTLKLSPTGKVVAPMNSSDGSPIVGIVYTRKGDGYWQYNEDGAVFAFGAASYHGGANSPDVSRFVIVGLSPTPDDGGYVLTDSNGGVYCYGNAKYFGAMLGGKLQVTP